MADLLSPAQKRPQSRATDHTGRRFGRLVAIARDGATRPAKWICQCDCGKTISAYASNLTTGKTTSCKCLNIETTRAKLRTHGASKSRLYRVWMAMKQRCELQTAKSFPIYGGRGLTVCDAWMTFEGFYADMGDPPFPRATLDRIDNNRGYEPGNVRWATSKENNRNRRNNTLLEIGGRAQCIAAWAEEVSIYPEIISTRLRRGWGPERAVFTPAKERNYGPR
jgi:hypothetical protein